MYGRSMYWGNTALITVFLPIRKKSYVENQGFSFRMNYLCVAVFQKDDTFIELKYIIYITKILFTE